MESAGWTEAEPSAAQGLIALNFGGVNTNLVWGASENRTPIEFVASTYNLLRAAQPGITFETISEGDVIVNEQTGLFGGFRALDSGGSAVGGGLIGAWVCPSGDTAFRLTADNDWGRRYGRATSLRQAIGKFHLFFLVNPNPIDPKQIRGNELCFAS